MGWQSFAVVFTGDLEFAPFINIVIELVNLDTSSTLMKRVKICKQKENVKQNNSKLGKITIFYLNMQIRFPMFRDRKDLRF